MITTWAKRPVTVERPCGLLVAGQPLLDSLLVNRQLGQLVGKSARLMTKRLRIQIPAGTAGEFSSPELTLCADTYSVTVSPLCYHSGT